MTRSRRGLYLLGQASQLDGCLEFAEDCFDELARRFYPGQPQVRHWLKMLDVGQLVNLKA